MPIKLKSTSGGSVTLDAPATASDFTLTVPATTANVFTTAGGTISGNVAFTSNNVTIGGSAISPVTGMRNRIINGDMRIDQRNAGASVTLSSGAVTYITDRWNAYKDSATATVKQSTDAPNNFTNSILWTTGTGASSASGGYCRIQQRVEGLSMSDLGWGTAAAKTVTFSFWVKSSLTGTFCLSLINNSVSYRSLVSTYTINSANTWEYKTITVPGETTGIWATNNTIGVYLGFDLGSGSNFITSTTGAWQATESYRTSAQVDVVGTSGATFYLTGVQMEEGSVATPFEFRHYGTEFALCQRYFEMSYDIGTVPATATATGSITAFPAAYTTYFPIAFKVNKRAIPTITGYSPFNGATGNMSVNLASNQALAGILSSGTFGACAYTAYVANVSAYLHFIASAEL